MTFPYTYMLRGSRQYQRLRIVTPATALSASLVIVEFEDGTRETVSRNHFRRAEK